MKSVSCFLYTCVLSTLFFGELQRNVLSKEETNKMYMYSAYLGIPGDEPFLSVVTRICSAIVAIAPPVT